MSAPRIDRIVPVSEVDVELLSHFRVTRAYRDDRPTIALGMISSIDGAVAIGGTSGGLGNQNDRRALTALRSTADVILIGSTTAASEGYGPPSIAGLRIAVATNSGGLDYESDLFASGAGFVLAPYSVAVPNHIDVVRAGDDHLDLLRALVSLREVATHTNVVVVEGGPRLAGALFDADLIDEAFLTTAPLFVGGPSSRLIAGAGEKRRSMRLESLLIDTDGYQFSRWVRPG